MRRGVRGQDLVFPLRFHDQRLFYALVQLFSSVIFTNSSQNKATNLQPIDAFLFPPTCTARCGFHSRRCRVTLLSPSGLDA